MANQPNNSLVTKKPEFNNKEKVQALAPQEKSGGDIKKIFTSYLPAIPKLLDRPTIDEDFESLPVFERITESLRYNALSLEYSISPKGGLRQWLKLNLSLLLLIGIPSLLFVPLFTYLAGGFEIIGGKMLNATQFIAESAFNILKTVGYIVATATILFFVFKIVSIRIGKRSNNKNSQDNKENIIDITPSDSPPQGNKTDSGIN